MRYPEVGEIGGKKRTSLQEKREHSPIVYCRTQNSEGFYSKDWDEDKQEEDEWQIPDKFQKISQMVFCNRILESHPLGDRVLSSHRV